MTDEVISVYIENPRQEDAEYRGKLMEMEFEGEYLLFFKYKHPQGREALVVLGFKRSDAYDYEGHTAIKYVAVGETDVDTKKRIIRFSGHPNVSFRTR